MGLSFRKSIKIGKNTRINLSKTGGIGISTGVKGARVSVNQKGVRTTIGKDGLQYRTDHSFKNTKSKNRVSNSSRKTNDYTTWEGIKALFSLVFYGFLLYLIIKFIGMVISG
ncbi:DUF4236 domain-containing protein [Clostridium scatologenes]|uniref:DUF4236 domain-containing protein n=1 Tax=Clostridium scatologenes TaxID=1548 RepID=A0A0E3JPB8_CLOSL|nr:DUF4236 domain-containing protein [Clostridium scatologenes]AKA70148.1 hypothetical protein CSCA_3023 [Clostridium scatologenes]